jgi:CRP-like cAMP-binding protein
VDVVEHSSIRNELMASLPPDILNSLLPYFRRIELPFRATLHTPNEPITSVLFPEFGYASMLATLEDGDVAEVGMIGREGMVGVSVVLEADSSPLEAVVQAEGIALRLDADVFQQALTEKPSLRKLMLRYAMAFHMQVTMTAACNGRHLLEQRLARWLLEAHDRIDGDELPMTHEFLATMLGVRRAGITVAAGALQKAGFIRYEQGKIRIIDRPGLEAAACECRTVVKREFARLLGPIASGV